MDQIQYCICTRPRFLTYFTSFKVFNENNKVSTKYSKFEAFDPKKFTIDAFILNKFLNATGGSKGMSCQPHLFSFIYFIHIGIRISLEMISFCFVLTSFGCIFSDENSDFTTYS